MRFGPRACPSSPAGLVEAARFTRRGADLWSLAYELTSAATARARTAATATALRRAGLRPARAGVGEAGWVVTKKDGTTYVVWQRRKVVGVILLTVHLQPTARRTIATQYAAVSDAHMEHLLSRTAWQRVLGARRA